MCGLIYLKTITSSSTDTTQIYTELIHQNYYYQLQIQLIIYQPQYNNNNNNYYYYCKIDKQMKYGIPLSVITSTIAACVMFGAYSRKVDLEYDKRVRGIITLSIVSILAFLKRTPRLQQKLSYHNFADQRCLCCGVPNTLDVLSNLPFMFVGLLGLDVLYRGPISEYNQWEKPQLQNPYETESWAIFFVSIALVALGSGYYHWKPDSNRLVWDRLPMSIAFTTLYYVVIQETVDIADYRLLLGLVFIGMFSVILWHFTDDLRLYAIVQGYCLLTIPLYYVVFHDKRRYEDNHHIYTALFLYIVAKLVEAKDKQIFAKTGGIVSGHTLKHLFAAGASGWAIIILFGRI